METREDRGAARSVASTASTAECVTFHGASTEVRCLSDGQPPTFSLVGLDDQDSCYPPLYTLVESAKLAGVDPERYLLLCVRRALMKKAPVTPSEVTASMLIEDCELSEEQARSALALMQ